MALPPSLDLRVGKKKHLRDLETALFLIAKNRIFAFCESRLGEVQAHGVNDCGTS